MERVLIAILIGFIIALIVVLIMKSQLKSVRMNNEAAYYVKQGGLELSSRHDIFLYKQVTRTAKPKNDDKNHR